MSGKIIIDGKEYAVSDRFQKEVLDIHPDLASRNYGELLKETKKIVAVTDARRAMREPIPKAAIENGTIATPNEIARLKSLDRMISAHHAVLYLNGRSHTEFGMQGIDQAIVQETQKECGCVVHHVIDRHKVGTDELKLHDHFLPFSKACEKHKQ